MKKSRVVIIICLAILMGLGWVTQLGSIVKNNTQYKSFVERADKNYEDKLYQKAITNYESALKIKNSEKVIDKMLLAYEASYLEKTTTKKDYAKALLSICEGKSNSAKYWEMLLNLHINTTDFTSAYDIVKKCEKTNAKSETLDKLINDVKYSYTIKKKTYTEVYQSPEGDVTVFDSTQWGVLDATGEWLYESEYDFCSPLNAKGDVCLVNEFGPRIFDEKGVIQNKLELDVYGMKACSDDFVPVKLENGRWKYYSRTNKKLVFDEYTDVASFNGDRALVKTTNNWVVLGSDGKFDESISFDDVKLYGNGTYIYKEKMVASQRGKFYLFNEKFEKISDTGYSDLDIYMGDYIAFKDDNGKWGFIDESGKVVIKAQYNNAKSFSNGLAAVFNGETWGFINKKNELVIDSIFADAMYFTNQGMCMVSEYDGLYYALKLRFN